jgi:hypothetical protein
MELSRRVAGSRAEVATGRARKGQSPSSDEQRKAWPTEWRRWPSEAI